MTRRQALGAALAVAVVIANVAVWFARREPSDRFVDSRSLLRNQLASRWAGLDASPFDGIVGELDRVLKVDGRLEVGRNAAGFGESVALPGISDADRRDLIEAIAGAIEALAAGEPEALTAYMARHGMEPAPRALGEAFAEYGGPEGVGRNPRQQIATLWQRMAIDSLWSGWLPEATTVHLWKPRSLQHVSMVQLGRNESWLWGNQALFPSVYHGERTFEQASRPAPPRLADVRVVIEHEDRLASERSPYFFRFWSTDDGWQPLALKVVRTGDPAEMPRPVMLF